MTGKPSQATPVSLDDFIAGSDPITAPENSPVEASRSQNPINAKRSVGKPSLAPGEVRSKTVQITLTGSEWNKLKKQAGKIPISTFVRDKMKDKKII